MHTTVYGIFLELTTVPILWAGEPFLKQQLASKTLKTGLKSLQYLTIRLKNMIMPCFPLWPTILMLIEEIHAIRGKPALSL